MFFIYGADESKASKKAEYLLGVTGFQYRFFSLDRDYTRDQLQRLIPGTKVIPHIFHNTKYVGGLKELYDYLYNEVKEREHGDSDGDTDRKE